LLVASNDELDDLRASLLRGRPRELGPDEGDEAFERHILLAVRIHRAARLNQRNLDTEGAGWRRYFVEYFPDGRNWPADADFLWDKWRVGLLKDELPHGITHGQSGAHWMRLSAGGICVNLESMWDDFEYSVDRFVQRLREDEPHRKVVLRRLGTRSWTVRPIPTVPSEHLFPSPTTYPGSVNASVAASATTISVESETPETAI
jgi:hypothetical protein